MIKLTTPYGSSIEVNPRLVAAVYPNTGKFHPDAKSVVLIDGLYRAVQEPVEEIETLLKE